MATRPSVGMQVSWLKRENAEPDAWHFIELTLIPQYGEGPFRIRSVEQHPMGLLVKLGYQDGKLVRTKWSDPHESPPHDWRGEIDLFNWDQYLRAV